MARKSQTALVLLLTCVLVAGAAAAAAAQTTIRVMTFMPKEIEDRVVAAFTAQNPDVRVELEALPWAEYFTKLQTTIAGGTAADVVALNMENFTAFAALGALVDLDPYVRADGYDTGQYFPRVLELFRYQGRLHGLPGSFSTVVLFYNKQLYGTAAVAPPRDAWTWEDLIASARKLTRDTNNDGIVDQFGYAVAWWPMYVWLGGGDILSPDGRRTLIDQPGAVRGLQEMVDTWLVHKVAPSPSQLRTLSDWDMWSQGKLATYPIGPWGLAPFQGTPFDWDAAHHPPIAQRATFLFANPLAITSQSRNKDAAWRFLRFSAGPEGSRIRQGGGYEISPLRAVAEEGFGLGLAKPQNIRIFLEATAYAISPPALAQWNEIQAAIDEQLDLARIGRITAQEAMQRAARTVNQVLAR